MDMTSLSYSITTRREDGTVAHLLPDELPAEVAKATAHYKIWKSDEDTYDRWDIDEIGAEACELSRLLGDAYVVHIVEVPEFRPAPDEARLYHAGKEHGRWYSYAPESPLLDQFYAQQIRKEVEQQALPQKPYVYISGKMSGLPEYGKELFAQAKEQLSAMGYAVVSPWDLGQKLIKEHEEKGLEPPAYVDFMRVDFAEIMMPNRDMTLFMLPNWKDSPGGVAEHALATSLKLPIMHDYDTARKLVDAYKVNREAIAAYGITDPGHMVYEDISDNDYTAVFVDNQGRQHREHGPAVFETSSFTELETWMHHGKEHREDGPSHYDRYSGNEHDRRWCRHGVELSAEERALEEAVYAHVRQALENSHDYLLDLDWRFGYQEMALDLAKGNEERAATIIATAREEARQMLQETPALPKTITKGNER